ncbi:MAG: ATP-binding cassette domain-containing protein [Dysgonamonadaceae bacterium]|jgi:lipopolysaccharide transport system ATP-binding protein|nr:ATP-binding cassette domain-containing protein [Dysgonamonadaceae bacterium]
MDDIAIKFENISKQYRLGLVSTKTLSHDLNRWWQTSILRKEDPYLKIGETNDRSKKGESEYVWALRDITFDVKTGEVLGIIGKNGAGKSTLLKILSRVTTPTTGIIKAKGRIASLLEVGTGFHPELTGRENIYMNGSIMGMTKKEIDSKLDEIVEFAGVARYLDTPVKRYSSGMTVRLGFSIAAHLEPEILVVDEVLAVGDAEFQKKAIGKMKEVSQGDGRTVLFVSHNMAAISNLCNHLCCLKNGSVTYLGDVQEGISIYLNENQDQSEKQIENISEAIKQLKPDEAFELLDVYLNSPGAKIYTTDNPVNVIFQYRVKKKVMGLRVGFDIKENQTGSILFRSFHDETNEDIDYIEPGTYIAQATIPPNLLRPGFYSLSILATLHCVRWIIYDQLFLDLYMENITGINSIYSDNRPGVIMPLIAWENSKE